jgi:coenzyme F420-0:L-glutamate ligase/coenzyme F420-1:gamma-L-glutamate ligase
MTHLPRARTPERLELDSWPWPDIDEHSDLAGLVCSIPGLLDGDVVVITSKVVSKAEARVSTRERTAVVAEETRRVLARRGETVIAETRHGFVLAAAGVDSSNVREGVVLSLPIDPDESARALRADIRARIGVNVAVVISDTAGRAWRNGQTDLAIGCAGIEPLLDLHGHLDTEGQPLAVTEPAVADAIASAADLVKGKSTGRPVAVLRGLSASVLPPGGHGPGATALVRAAEGDMFGLGAREAVETAVHRNSRTDLEHFARPTGSDPVPLGHLTCDHPDVRLRAAPLAHDTAEHGWFVDIDVREGADEQAWLAAGRAAEQAETLAAAYRLRPIDPSEHHSPITGWRAAVRLTWIVA